MTLRRKGHWSSLQLDETRGWWLETQLLLGAKLEELQLQGLHGPCCLTPCPIMFPIRGMDGEQGNQQARGQWACSCKPMLPPDQGGLKGPQTSTDECVYLQ